MQSTISDEVLKRALVTAAEEGLRIVAIEDIEKIENLFSIYSREITGGHPTLYESFRLGLRICERMKNPDLSVETGEQQA